MSRLVSFVRAQLDRVVEVRPARSGRPHRYDWIELAALLAVFAASALTPPRTASGEPNAPLMTVLASVTGGGLCLWKRVTGIDCAGCGLTRGFVQLAHGHPVEAVTLNPLTPVVFVALLGRLAATGFACLLRRELRHRLSSTIAWKLWGAFIAALGLLTIYRTAASLLS